MTMSYTIWIVSPPADIRTRCFDEVALGLQAAFRALGQDVPIVRDSAQIRGTPIVFGANMLIMHRMRRQLPKNAIIFNMEQVHRDSWWFEPKRGYPDLLR